MGFSAHFGSTVSYFLRYFDFWSQRKSYTVSPWEKSSTKSPETWWSEQWWIVKTTKSFSRYGLQKVLKEVKAAEAAPLCPRKSNYCFCSQPLSELLFLLPHTLTASRLPWKSGGAKAPRNLYWGHKGEEALSKENKCKRWQTTPTSHPSLKQLLVTLLIDYRDRYSAPATWQILRGSISQHSKFCIYIQYY